MSLDARVHPDADPDPDPDPDPNPTPDPDPSPDPDPNPNPDTGFFSPLDAVSWMVYPHPIYPGWIA